MGSQELIPDVTTLVIKAKARRPVSLTPGQRYAHIEIDIDECGIRRIQVELRKNPGQQADLPSVTPLASGIKPEILANTNRPDVRVGPFKA